MVNPDKVKMYKLIEEYEKIIRKDERSYVITLIEDFDKEGYELREIITKLKKGMKPYGQKTK